ncbi:hypothetical protein FHP05_14875 [Cerasibacillus terrae]|uniref:Uncharacterized protein n=1 Tax=Cerasibacillus terrae TaxID=2498845 RepID=A0A5C8NFU9_9BACI|nr:hypothetical protein [Cerasibacillus terrae]TXL57803.1 hypothetical protein FHP05_14875 [Cerasibacillus terrae]
MTQYLYIASPRKLPQGSFGLNPVSSKQPHIFASELDFVHLYFENNYDEKLKRKFSYSPHFSFAYQVATYSNHIPFKFELIETKEEKCLNILYSYLENAIQSSGMIEYFTSLSGKEDQDIFKKRKVRWKEIKTPYDLVLEDREFWVITL